MNFRAIFTPFFNRNRLALLFRHRVMLGAWLISLVGVIALSGTIQLPATLKRLEMSLLDFRLKLRAEQLTPSSDIIVAAMDRRTRDEARNQPELGINNRVLPRKKVAQIIDFFAQRDAKAIILDLSFEEPQTPEDDRALREAIRKAGNVYLAASVELPYSEYKTRQQKQGALSQQADFIIALNNYRLLPHLTRQARLHAALPNGCNTGYWQSGLEAYFSVPTQLSLPPELFQYYWRQQCDTQSGLSFLKPLVANTVQSPYVRAIPNASLPDSETQSTLASEPLANSAAYSTTPTVSSSNTTPNDTPSDAPDAMNAMYRQQCLEQMYHQVFSRNPGYLSLLERMKTPIIDTLPGTDDRAKSRREQQRNQTSYCLISAVVEPILAASRGVGITSVDYDRDAMMREVPLFYHAYRGNTYPYLGLRPVLDVLNTQPPRMADQAIILGDRHIPLTEHQTVLINWRNPSRLIASLQGETASSEVDATNLPETEDINAAEQGHRALGYGHLYRMVSAIDILKQKADENARSVPAGTLSGANLPSLYRRYGEPDSGALSFKNKIVIYGDAIEDVHRTPVGNRIYGPEVLATSLDMFLHDRQFIREAPPFAVWFVVLLVGGLIFFCQISSPRLAVGFLFGITLMVLYWIYNIIAFIQAAYWFPLVLPSLFLIVVLTTGVVYRYSIHDREKRQLTRIFSRYVSPQVMDTILANPETSLDSMAGAEKNLTVLFSDLKGFTERCNKEDPRVMVKQLNEFFTVMTRIILKHQGTYDKYIGDCIMAFFGAPAEFPNHAEKACAAALEMQEALRHLNEKWRNEGVPELDMGIGLSSGDMIVGNFGSEDLQNFTVMGNAVNLGSRLESLTRKVNAPIVISETTAIQAGNTIHVIDLGHHELKGFQEPVRAYALQASESGPSAFQAPDVSENPSEPKTHLLNKA